MKISSLPFLFFALFAIPAMSSAQQVAVSATETLASLEMDINQDDRNDLITVTQSGKTTALNIILGTDKKSASASRLLISNTNLFKLFVDDVEISLKADPAGGFWLVVENPTFHSENHFVMEGKNVVTINHAKWIDRNSSLTSVADWPQQSVSYQLSAQSSVNIERTLAAQSLITLQKLPFAEQACVNGLPERCAQTRTAALQQELTQYEQALTAAMQQVYGEKSDSYGKSYLSAFTSYRKQDFSSWQQYRDAHCYQQFYIDGMSEREISSLAEQCRLSNTLDRLVQTQTTIKGLKK